MIKAKTRISLADMIVCVVAVAVALMLLVLPARSSGDSVYVKTDGGDLVFDLGTDCTEVISSNDHTLTLEIKDGTVRVTRSDCPDGICVSTGIIKDPSKVIVCVPAKVLVRIQNSGGNADADFIAGR